MTLSIACSFFVINMTNVCCRPDKSRDIAMGFAALDPSYALAAVKEPGLRRSLLALVEATAAVCGSQAGVGDPASWNSIEPS
jgi:hypothetical protein